MSQRRILFLAQARDVMDLYPRFKEEGLETGLAENLKGALGFIDKTRPELVFSRPSLPGYRVDDLLARAAEDPDFPPVIAFTARGSAEEAQRLMELGARDYWMGPLVWDKIEAALPELPPAPSSRPPEAPVAPSKPKVPVSGDSHRIVGSHPAVARVLALAKQVAPSKASILISGESGTGKEMFARFVHTHSDRKSFPFIAINCAALPEHLLESELFGHEKGAFTGAISRKPGKFELADNGTLLLDEISEMDMGLQAKLLRVLQEGELDRVGGVETVKVDVRVLATTNREIEKEVETGKFRQDLYFRLNVIPLKLPALRERGDDVLNLARFFVDKYCRQYSLPQLQLSQEAVDWMLAFDWPGNVRELQNLMERAVLLAGKGPITKVHFLLESEDWPLLGEEAAEEGVEAGAEHAPAPTHGDVPVGGFLGGSVVPLYEVERIMILRGLEETSGNRTQAAELLGISVRTLRNKLNEYRSQGMDI